PREPGPAGPSAPLQQAQPSAKVVSPHQRERRRLAGREQLVEPAHALRGPMRNPVVLHRGGDIEAATKVAARDGLLKDRSDVVDFELAPGEPLEKPVAGLVR